MDDSVNAFRRMWSHARFPPPPGTDEVPLWNGLAFQIGDSMQHVLIYDPEVASGGWSNEANSLYATAIAHHYIDVASRRNMVQSIRRWINRSTPTIIDVGCGAGHTLQVLLKSFPTADVLGADLFQESLCQLSVALPGVPLLQFDIAKCPLPEHFVDVVVALNVLEHIEDDEAALYHVFRILKHRGIACLEVPVGPALYDMYDEELGHFRRYAAMKFVSRLRKIGFHILDHSHLGFFAFPAFWAVKKWARHRGLVDSVKRRAAIVNGIKASGKVPFMCSMMAVEEWMRRWMYLPFGIRCIVTCRRP